MSYRAGRHLVNWINSENKRRIGTGQPFIKYKFLGGWNANRISLWLNRKVDAIFYMGHGLADRLGDNFMKFIPILDKNNIHWFKNKIIYTMSCLSGLQLAKIAIAKGVRAYYGQTKKYYGFLPRVGRQIVDDWQNLITIIPKALMLGSTTYEAMNKYDTFSADLHQRYKSQSPKNSQILFSNAYNLNLYGLTDVQI